MSWTLDSLTLPNPKEFKREQIEIAEEHLTLTGRTVKDFRARKERYTLTYRNLTQAEITSILDKRDLNQALNFSVSETYLTITTTSVLVDIQVREYNSRGEQYREDIELILTEES